MWSVDATRARTLSAAMVLIVLATPLLDTVSTYPPSLNQLFRLARLPGETIGEYLFVVDVTTY